MHYYIKTKDDNFKDFLNYIDTLWKTTSVVSVSYCSSTVVIESEHKVYRDLLKMSVIDFILPEREFFSSQNFNRILKTI